MPAVLFDISEELRNQHPIQPPYPTLTAPDWCSYDRCGDMPTDIEKLCCGIRPENCISLPPEFEQYCLEPQVLDLANVYRNGVLAIDMDEDINQRRRQFVMWWYRE
ncbi:P2X purinoceptor 7-like [Patella vulgata]|uniref:P2X purinoceptor 7-like n=1 Tax=Patella vulgata TaxID=6465 RepID=UPI0021804541|nr:P2X purinoceptor 7-like [Patella vulgata]